MPGTGPVRVKVGIPECQGARQERAALHQRIPSKQWAPNEAFCLMTSSGCPTEKPLAQPWYLADQILIH